MVETLISESQSFGVEVKLQQQIENVEQQNKTFIINTDKDDFSAKSLVIASGGPSIPAMGSSDFALKIAKQFSIKTIPFKAALVPFTFSEKELDGFIKELAGVSTFVEVCTQSGKCFKEAILFTHRGISGPAALQASSYWHKGESIDINLLPEINILDWLTEQQKKHPKAELKTILAYQLPKRLAQKLCEFYLNNKPMQQFTSQQLDAMAEKLGNWKLTPSGTEGMRTAEVSCGGIDTDELSSKTFEAKSVTGLYFIGEAVDVTGHLGGYNFQWAWSSGWCAGQYV